MEQITRKIASFKYQASSSMPMRLGPIQCVRSCTNCEPKPKTNDLDESLTNIHSFDDLVSRKSMIFPRYRTIQYHTGQVELLKRTLELKSEHKTLYIIAADDIEDGVFLDMVLEYSKIPKVKTVLLRSCVEESGYIIVRNDSDVLSLMFNDRSYDEPCFSYNTLKLMIERFIDLANSDPTYDLNLVPVAITKDRDGRGSLCVQIVQPYSLRNYISRQSSEVSLKAHHLSRHLIHDIIHNAVILPTHLVAFLLNNLTLDYGIKFEDLVEHVEWFRRFSIDIDIHFGFTGQSHHVVQFALSILSREVICCRKSKVYIPIAPMVDLSRLVTRKIAVYGLIARAILDEYNRQSEDEQIFAFYTCRKHRVTKPAVLEQCMDYAAKLDRLEIIKPPCKSIEYIVSHTFHQMETLGRYFRVEEPKIKYRQHPQWEGDDESDGDYFQSRHKDPAFQSWIVLTSNEQKLDRLNMFINAISHYFD